MKFVRIILILALGVMLDASAMRKRKREVEAPCNAIRTVHVSLKHDLPMLDYVQHVAHCCCCPCDERPCVKQYSGGVNNAGVFEVKSSVGSFVIKFLPQDMREEVIARICIVFNEGLGRQSFNYFPKLLCFAQCHTASGSDLVAEVMEQAKGVSLENILKNTKISKKKKQKIFHLFGEWLAAMHKENLDGEGRTTVHGDLHLGNVFYDDATNSITFIDCETSAYSTSPNPKQSILWDFTLSMMCELLYGKDISENLSCIDVLIPCYKAFIQGYVASFDKKYQKNLFEYIKNFIVSWIDASLIITDFCFKQTIEQAQQYVASFADQWSQSLKMHKAFKDVVENIWDGTDGFLKYLDGKDEATLNSVKKNLETFKLGLFEPTPSLLSWLVGWM